MSQRRCYFRREIECSFTPDVSLCTQIIYSRVVRICRVSFPLCYLIMMSKVLESTVITIVIYYSILANCNFV